MKNPYKAMEIAYKNLEKKGIKSWGERDHSSSLGKEIDPDSLRFIEDCIAQQWFPESGSCLELGCGTAPILRYFCRRGFKGTGLELCPTAIKMAQEQSKDLPIIFCSKDVTRIDGFGNNCFDLAIDGFCLHCIFFKEDRKQFLLNTFSSLKPGGVFILLTMVSPVNSRKFKELNPGQIIRNRIIYSPFEKADEYTGNIEVKGKKYLPTRYLDHWKNIIASLKKAGFVHYLHRLHFDFTREPTGFLCVACKKPD